MKILTSLTGFNYDFIGKVIVANFFGPSCILSQFTVHTR